MYGTISRTSKVKKREKNTQISTQAMVVPVLMYHSENWSLNRSDKREIEVAEMRFLRPMVGYTLLDKKKM